MIIIYKITDNKVDNELITNGELLILLQSPD